MVCVTRELTASAGNHAQGVALAGRELGIACTIVMPLNTPSIKYNNVDRMGAKVVLHGADFDEAKRECLRLAKVHGLTDIPPFDDPYVIAGQGTCGVEILRRGSHMNLNGITRSPNHSPRPASRAVATPAHGDSSDVDLLEIANPIETTQQFHDWFQRVEQSMEREQEEIYRTHLHEIDHYVNACDDVLEQLDDARGLLSEMEANYRFVEDNSRALQLACENMLDEQVRLYPAARRGCSAARTKSLILVFSRRNT